MDAGPNAAYNPGGPRPMPPPIGNEKLDPTITSTTSSTNDRAENEKPWDYWLLLAFVIILAFLVQFLCVERIRCLVLWIKGKITGQEWKSKLVYAQYYRKVITNRLEFKDLNAILGDVNSSFFSDDELAAFYERIVKIRVLTIPLHSVVDEIEVAEKFLTHHILAFETETGHHFTAEKLSSHILIQSCPRLPILQSVDKKNIVCSS